MITNIYFVRHASSIYYPDEMNRPLSEKGFKDAKRVTELYFNEIMLRYWNDFNFSLPNGESGYVAQNRGVRAIKRILSSCHGENIVIGTHENIMVLIMNYYDRKYNYDFWKSLSMPDIYELSFEDEVLVDVKRIWS